MGSQKVKTNTKNTMKIRKTVLAGADKLLKRLGMGVLVAALVTGAVLAVKHFQKSDAATYVDVSYGWNGYVGPYYFGDMYSQYDGAENRTSFYSVASNGYSYGAMCAQPMFGGVDDLWGGVGYNKENLAGEPDWAVVSGREWAGGEYFCESKGDKYPEFADGGGDDADAGLYVGA